MSLRSIGLLLAIGLAMAGCVGGLGQTPEPTHPPIPITEADAVARVIAHEPRFAGITRRDPNLIGQANWFEVQEASGVGAYIVTMRVGWGDCPAGCMDEHRWIYVIAPTGAVSLQSESGPPTPPDAWPAQGAGVGAFTGIRVTAVLGPICPVERVPPDPACAPRTVPGAIISIRDDQGNEFAQAKLDSAGSAFIETPPGHYRVLAARVVGLLGVPDATPAEVFDGLTTDVVLTYDTGIR